MPKEFAVVRSEDFSALPASDALAAIDDILADLAEIKRGIYHGTSPAGPQAADMIRHVTSAIAIYRGARASATSEAQP
jgi:hypothetical protein